MRTPAVFSTSLPRRLRGDVAVWAMGLMLLAALLGRGGLAAPRQAAGTGSGGSLWISESPLDNGRRLLLVVDQELRNLAIYHVDGATGGVALKSSRDISWDLMVGDFNALPPKPSELRRMLEASQTSPPAR